ncbi:MAG: TIGR03085 family metal-binding protein [Actinomycetes bacterium]
MSDPSTQRTVLAATLREAGPDAPTLCEGWTSRDLAAHLVVRERRPDIGPGLVLPTVPVLAGWTDRVRRGYAKRDYQRLVDELASGPPWYSPFALPGFDARANLTEFFVHCEDVRRAQPGWQPRLLDDGYTAALWQAVSRGGRLMFRRVPFGVTLRTPGGTSRQVRDGTRGVVLSGQPGELLLLATGRRRHALVEISGPDDALQAFEEARLGI